MAEFEGRVKTLQRQGELQADLAGFLSRMALQAKGRVNVDVVPAPPPEPAVVTIPATDVPKAGSYDPDKHQKKHEKKDEEAQEHDGD